MRLRGRKNIRESLEAQTDLVVLEPHQWAGRWHEFFGNDRPIYAELGMGKGQFISTMSGTHEEINFIGMDMYDELLRRGTEKARAVWREKGLEKVPNLALVRGNVEELEKMFAPGELSRIYLNFSDPWPKKKHVKRRLTHPRFLEMYRNVLNADGEIHFKTDSRILFEYSLNSFSDSGIRLREISLDLHRDGLRNDLVLTEYETKFHEQGMPIYRLEAVIGERALTRHLQQIEEVRQDAVRRDGDKEQAVQAE